jgi:hypothetical protein
MATYKIDGAKFASMDDLKAALWEVYKDKMAKDEFEKYVKENTQEVP